MASTTRLATVYFLLTLAAASSAIKCWKCGQYSDGVGSITPCSNKTAVRLEECPSNAKYCITRIYGGRESSRGSRRPERLPRRLGREALCLSRPATSFSSMTASQKEKYVSELTTVRDCVPTCSEKEWWGARTFCCDSDECNSSYATRPLTVLSVIAVLITAAVAR